MKNQKPNILWITIYYRLIEFINVYEIDIRSIDRWLKFYPECFPKFMMSNQYLIHFNSKLLRYEIYKTK